MSELDLPYEEYLVRWDGVWIRPAVLAVLKAAAGALPQQDADDVRHALQKEFHGKPCRAVSDLPARLRNALKL